jgi:hypothetical protein
MSSAIQFRSSEFDGSMVFRMSNIFRRICFGSLVLAAVSGWAQAPPAADTPVAAVSGPGDSADRMLAPPPVSGEDYPVVFASETRTNVLRGGVTFDFAHSDNVLAGAATNPVTDNSYSIWPTLALDETTGRTKLTFSYAPGFTFYQKTSARDETDQNVAVDFQYRLSPHVTMMLKDSFQKSSDAFNSPGEGLGAGVSGSLQGSNNLIIAPLADRLSNTGNAGLSYQFGANAMLGVTATFTNLHYPSPGQVLDELYDTSSQAVSVYHSLRFSRRQYLGVTYQYQRLLAYPGSGTTDTQTNSALVFYTWLPTSRFSISGFGGPQFSATDQPGLSSSHSLSPSAGGSIGWQGERTALAVSYSHSINAGGGLIGASTADTANAFVRQQLAKHWNAVVNGGYVNNRVIPVVGLANTSGHSVTGSAAVERAVTSKLSVQAGYTRLHQIYQNVAVISQNPDTNREWVTVSYQFTKPLGR